MTTQPREIFTPEQAAEYLQLSRETIYRYIREGKLLAARFGRTYRIPKRNIDLLLWESQTGPGFTPRDYSREDIEEFLEADKLDDEQLAIAQSFLNRLP